MKPNDLAFAIAHNQWLGRDDKEMLDRLTKMVGERSALQMVKRSYEDVKEMNTDYESSEGSDE